jgi:hypothetical protein
LLKKALGMFAAVKLALYRQTTKRAEPSHRSSAAWIHPGG